MISLDRQANNGTGRNFLLQQYLGQGSYQVSVEAEGKTRGRMGVSAARTTLMDGGALSLGVPARDTIAAGDGLVYTFDIAEAGQYRLQSLGLGRIYRMRLEDADGWPIVAPNTPADLTMDFQAGGYRLVILPQPVDAKIVTLLDTLKTEILGGADAAYDTLIEIQQLLQDGTSGLDALLAAINNRVRFDGAQTLTMIEQQQARENIGAIALAAIGDADTDLVAVFEGALA